MYTPDKDVTLAQLEISISWYFAKQIAI